MRQLRFTTFLVSFITTQCLVMSCTSRSYDAGMHRPHADKAVTLDPNMWPMGVSLAAQPIRDTVVIGSPIEVAYLVRNRGGVTLYRNDPRYFQFEIRSPSGVLLERSNNTPQEGQLGAVMDLTLPNGSLFGSVIDLTCGSNGYLASGTSSPACDWKYSFLGPGNYLVLVKYQPVAPPLPKGAVVAGMQADSFTITLIRPN